MKGILQHSIDAYLGHIRLISLFSLSLLFAFLIPLFVRLPTYVSLGGIFLRTGSIPELTSVDAGVMVLSFLVSLFLISFAMVNINLVIRSERTSTHIGNEVIRGITKYTLNVFWLYLTAELLLLIIQLITFEWGVQEILSPILSFLIVLPFFYAPAGLVIDDLRPFRAVQKSLSMVLSKLPYFLLWLAISFVLLTIPELFLFAILPHGIVPWLVLALNSLLLMPFLIVLQTQIYMSKYSIVN